MLSPGFGPFPGPLSTPRRTSGSPAHARPGRPFRSSRGPARRRQPGSTSGPDAWAATAQPSAAFQERLEPSRPRRMPKFAQRFRLDLADALAGDRKALADLFERVFG